MEKLAKVKKEQAIPIAIVVAATAFTAATIGALVYRRIVLFFRTSSNQTALKEGLLLASPRQDKGDLSSALDLIDEDLEEDLSSHMSVTVKSISSVKPPQETSFANIPNNINPDHQSVLAKKSPEFCSEHELPIDTQSLPVFQNHKSSLSVESECPSFENKDVLRKESSLISKERHSVNSQKQNNSRKNSRESKISSNISIPLTNETECSHSPSISARLPSLIPEDPQVVMSAQKINSKVSDITISEHSRASTVSRISSKSLTNTSPAKASELFPEAQALESHVSKTSTANQSSSFIKNSEPVTTPKTVQNFSNVSILRSIASKSDQFVNQLNNLSPVNSSVIPKNASATRTSDKRLKTQNPSKTKVAKPSKTSTDKPVRAASFSKNTSNSEIRAAPTTRKSTSIKAASKTSNDIRPSISTETAKSENSVKSVQKQTQVKSLRSKTTVPIIKKSSKNLTSTISIPKHSKPRDPHQDDQNIRKPSLHKTGSQSQSTGKLSARDLREQKSGSAMSVGNAPADKLSSKDVRKKTTMQILSAKPKEEQTIQPKEEEIIKSLEDTPESVRAAAPVSKDSLTLPSPSVKESFSKNSITSVKTAGTATEHLEIESIPDYEDISASRATSGILCEADQVLNDAFLADPDNEITSEITTTDNRIEEENNSGSKTLLTSIWSQTASVVRVLSSMSVASAVSDPSILVDTLQNERKQLKKASSEKINVLVNTIYDSMDSATLQGSNDIPTEFVEHQPSRLSVEATDASVSEIPESFDIPFDSPTPPKLQSKKIGKPPKFSSAQHLRKYQSSGTIQSPKKRTSTRAIKSARGPQKGERVRRIKNNVGKEVSWSGTRLPAETGVLTRGKKSGSPVDASPKKPPKATARKPTVPKGPNIGRRSGQEILALRQPSNSSRSRKDPKEPSKIRSMAESSYVLARRLYSNNMRFGVGPMNFLFKVDRKDKDRTTKLSLGHVLGRTKLESIKETGEKKSPRKK